MKAAKKVELLAPAGNAEAFYGAIHAGADAIYLGGSRFGARSYAENFSEEELEQVFVTMDSVEEDPYDWTKSFLEEYGIDSSLDSIHTKSSRFSESTFISFPCR